MSDLAVIVVLVVLASVSGVLPWLIVSTLWKWDKHRD